MGFFDLKATYAICKKEVGLNRHRIANKEWICPKCLKKAGGFHAVSVISRMTPQEIKNVIANENAKQVELEAFTPTKKIGTYIEFDDNQKQWLIPDGF